MTALNTTSSPDSSRRTKWRCEEDPGEQQVTCSKILEILIVSKWRWARDWLILWSRDLLFARVFFAPTRHLESGDGPGDEVALNIFLSNVDPL